MLTLTLQDFDAKKIAESGQCFRMKCQSDGGVQVVAFGKVLTMYEKGEGSWEFSCAQEEFDTLWKEYFDLDADYSCYRNLCLPDDSFLREAMAAGMGIRILRQDPWEMLVSFIISQRKSIPAIRTAVELLCERFGTPFQDRQQTYYAFPTPQVISALSEQQLRDCGLGYRAPYVLHAASVFLDTPSLQNNTLSTEELRAALMHIHGVGIKVVECVSLFGYHRIEAFPIDVWIQRVVQNIYSGAFPSEYESAAGVLQQYLFCHARERKLTGKAVFTE